jgi:hypothetical protein
MIADNFAKQSDFISPVAAILLKDKLLWRPQRKKQALGIANYLGPSETN